MLTTGFPFIDKDLAGFPENKLSFALCDNPSSRLFFAFNIVNHFVKEKKLIYYIDLDTIFSSYILNEHNSFSNSDDFVLFTPKRDQLSTIISNICSIASTIFSFLSRSKLPNTSMSDGKPPGPIPNINLPSSI